MTWPPSGRQLAIGGCIAALLVATAAIFVFGVSPGNVAVFALILICPLMHIFMMRGMGHGGEPGCHTTQRHDGEGSDQSRGTRA